jgi:hypothetical protein
LTCRGRSRKVGIPSLDSRRWEAIAGRGRGFPVIYGCLARHDLVPEGRHLASDNGDCSRAGVSHQSGLIVTKDEFPGESEGLNSGVRRGLWKETVPHGDGVGICQEMSGMSNKNVSPTTFLVNDASKLASAIVPWCFWLACETLDSTKRRVLRVKNQTREECVKCVMSHLDGDCMRVLASCNERDQRGGLL